MKLKLTTRDSNGFALMLTLWVLAALSVMALTLSMVVRANVKVTSYLKKDVRAFYLARGAVKRIAVELASNDTFNKDDNSSGKSSKAKTKKTSIQWLINPSDWSLEKGSLKDNQEKEGKKEKSPPEEYIECEIWPEDIKLPLNKVTSDMLSKQPDISPVIATAISSAVKAKKKTGGFRSTKELLALKAITPDIYYGTKEKKGLTEFLTAYTDGKININKAKKETLEAIPGLKKEMANKIWNRIKQGNPFKNSTELKSFAKINDEDFKKIKQWIRMNSVYYKVKVMAYVNGITRNVEAVVKAIPDQKDKAITGDKDKDENKVEVIYIDGG